MMDEEWVFNPLMKEYYDRLPSNPFGETVEEQLLTLETAQLRMVRRLIALEKWVREHN
jgi:hypothetical protein